MLTVCLARWEVISTDEIYQQCKCSLKPYYDVTTSSYLVPQAERARTSDDVELLMIITFGRKEATTTDV